MFASIATQGLSQAGDAIAASMPDVLPRVADQPLTETQTTPLPPQPTLATRELNFNFRAAPWCIRIELSDDPAESDWLSVSDRGGGDPDLMEIRVSMAHPFMVAFAQTDPESIDALLRVAAKDPQPIPPGEYRLYSTETSDNKVFWLYRLET